MDALLERRRRLGLDRHDEIWEGVVHMAFAPHNAHADVQHQLAVLLDAPARMAGLRPLIGGEFNIGDPEDYRIPDGGLLRDRQDAIWNPTAALVVEIVSPGDESWEKLSFYAAHRVDEVLIVDPVKRSVDWLGLSDGQYRPVERSELLEFAVGELAEQRDWPELD